MSGLLPVSVAWTQQQANAPPLRHPERPRAVLHCANCGYVSLRLVSRFGEVRHRVFVIMAMLRGVRLATGTAVACSVFASAPAVATAEPAKPCEVLEPDSLEISWTAPCDEGRWLLDPQSGCRMWDWHPAPEDTSTWTGACSPAPWRGPRRPAAWPRRRWRLCGAPLPRPGVARRLRPRLCALLRPGVAWRLRHQPCAEPPRSRPAGPPPRPWPFPRPPAVWRLPAPRLALQPQPFG